MRKEKILPSFEVLRDCLRYERKTGLLFWRFRPDDYFPTWQAAAKWNGKFAGREAFTCVDNGYRVGQLFNVRYKAHRIIWKMVTECEPPAIMDHRDRNRSNNKWKNLREATPSQNLINRRLSDNKAKALGIRESECGNWEARITKNKKAIHLGTYVSKKAAISARAEASKKLYGEFAPCN